MSDDLTENTIDMYMMRSYTNPQCIGIEEYNDDVSRIKYIKRLLNRYKKTGELKHQLLLNHIIVIYNVYPYALALCFAEVDGRLRNLDLPPRTPGTGEGCHFLRPLDLQLYVSYTTNIR